MKRLLITGIVTATVLMSGCYYYGPCLDGSGPVVTEKRDCSDYTAVSNENSFEVLVNEADSFRVEVEAQANLLPVIETVVSGNTLIVRQKKGTCIRNGSSVTVHVSLPMLEALHLSGSGKIIADVGDSDEFECANSGSGHLTIDSIYAGLISHRNSGSGSISVTGSFADEVVLVNSGSGIIDAGTIRDAPDVEISHSSSGRISARLLHIKRLDALLSGSGRIDLKGDTQQAEYTLNSSGKIDALELQAADVTATATGSGKIYAWATETLDATITGSGDIIYLGDPVISLNITGSGELRSY